MAKIEMAIVGEVKELMRVMRAHSSGEGVVSAEFGEHFRQENVIVACKCKTKSKAKPKPLKHKSIKIMTITQNVSEHHMLISDWLY